MQAPFNLGPLEFQWGLDNFSQIATGTTASQGPVVFLLNFSALQSVQKLLSILLKNKSIGERKIWLQMKSSKLFAPLFCRGAERTFVQSGYYRITTISSTTVIKTIDFIVTNIDIYMPVGSWQKEK